MAEVDYKVSLDLIWLRNESLEDTANLPPPDAIAAEIVEDLEAALAEFFQIVESAQDRRIPNSRCSVVWSVPPSCCGWQRTSSSIAWRKSPLTWSRIPSLGLEEAVSGPRRTLRSKGPVLVGLPLRFL